MPEAAAGGVLRKKVLYKMSQISEETPVPEETPVNFAKIFKNTFFTEQLRRTASEMQIFAVMKPEI